uniref:Uncharacterized protein n=1 Tax=Salix viminalis TaxID=40686 RepID=A0A6N2LYR9_SALVM
MNTSGDNQEHYGWSERTSGSEMLACKFSDTEENKTEEVLNLLQYTSICSALLAEEYVSSSFPIGFLSEIIDSKQCQTLESVLASIENQENLQTSHIIMTTLLKVHVRGGLFEKSTDLLIELDTLGFAKEKGALFLIDSSSLVELKPV